MIGIAFMSAWLPQPASTHAGSLDGSLAWAYLAGSLVLVGFMGLAVAYAVIYRRQDRDQLGAPAGPPNRVFLAAWVLGAVVLSAVVFVSGFDGYIDRSVAPYGAEEITVTARQWDWDFDYGQDTVQDTLHVPAGKPVKLILNSEDVLHSLAIPAMRVNQAIVPGRQSEAWFTPTEPGSYQLQSNIFSGDGQVDMNSALIVHRAEDYAAWLEGVQDVFKGRTIPEVGELLVTRNGCLACHSVTGQKLVGPTFKDLYGHEFDTVEGVRITADDAYIKESILEPNASVIAGYQPVMVSYADKFDEEELDAIVTWLKTLSSLGGIPEADAEAGAEVEQDGSRSMEEGN